VLWAGGASWAIVSWLGRAEGGSYAQGLLRQPGLGHQLTVALAVCVYVTVFWPHGRHSLAHCMGKLKDSSYDYCKGRIQVLYSNGGDSLPAKGGRSRELRLVVSRVLVCDVGPTWATAAWATSLAVRRCLVFAGRQAGKEARVLKRHLSSCQLGQH
jgi:hypothetical protein